jgi:hypothetical protein
MSEPDAYELLAGPVHQGIPGIVLPLIGVPRVYKFVGGLSLSDFSSAVLEADAIIMRWAKTIFGPMTLKLRVSPVVQV